MKVKFMGKALALYLLLLLLLSVIGVIVYTNFIGINLTQSLGDLCIGLLNMLSDMLI